MCQCSEQDRHDYGPCGEDCDGYAGYSDANEPHDDQVQVWADDVADALLQWLNDFASYDDKIEFFETLKSEIKSIAVAAHAAGMQRAKVSETAPAPVAKPLPRLDCPDDAVPY